MSVEIIMFQDILSQVSSVMIRKVFTVKPDQTLSDAAKTMRSKKVGSVIVIDRGKVKGIITESDFLRLAARGGDSKLTTVGDVMSHPVITCKPTARIIDAFILMRKNAVRHLPVVNNGRLVGMISIRDLIAAGQVILPYLI